LAARLFANRKQMLATGTDEFSSVADNSYLGRTANLQASTGISLWSSILDGSYDDAGVSIFNLGVLLDLNLFTVDHPRSLENR
jgi:hypothetical protein